MKLPRPLPETARRAARMVCLISAVVDVSGILVARESAPVCKPDLDAAMATATVALEKIVEPLQTACEAMWREFAKLHREVRIIVSI